MGFHDVRLPGGSRELWSLRSDVFIEDDVEGDALILYNRWGDIVLHSVGVAADGLLHRMQLGPVSLDNAAFDPEDPNSRQDLLRVLESVQHLVVRTLSSGDLDQPLLSLIPMTADAKTLIEPVDPAWPLRLSTFALLSSDGAEMAIQSPLSLHRVVLHQPEIACLVAAATRPRSPASMAKLLSLPDGLVLDTMAYLVATGMVVAAEPGSHEKEPRFSEDFDPALRVWSPTELAFHAYSTLGRHDRDFGATHWFGEEPSAPRVTPRRLQPLRRPRTAALPERPPLPDPPAPADRRISGPPDEERLGELLYHGARQNAEPESADPQPERALRYYVVVEQCSGIDPSVYAYEGRRHALAEISVPESARHELLAQARIAANLRGVPPVLILISVRFGRILWKYSGGGYARALTQTGAAQRDLVRLAGTLGLPAATVGMNEIEESSRILGLDWRTEAVLGGVALGRHRGH